MIFTWQLSEEEAKLRSTRRELKAVYLVLLSFAHTCKLAGHAVEWLWCMLLNLDLGITPSGWCHGHI